MDERHWLLFPFEPQNRVLGQRLKATPPIMLMLVWACPLTVNVACITRLPIDASGVTVLIW